MRSIIQSTLLFKDQKKLFLMVQGRSRFKRPGLGSSRGVGEKSEEAKEIRKNLDHKWLYKMENLTES